MQVSIAVIFKVPSWGCLRIFQRDYDPTRQNAGTAAGKSVEQIQAEFKVPAEFAHYGGPAPLKAFPGLCHHQLLERGFRP